MVVILFHYIEANCNIFNYGLFQKSCFYLLYFPSKMMKNTAFYFMLKALFVFEIFTFLSWLFGYVEKWLDKKAVVNFKIYDFTD